MANPEGPPDERADQESSTEVDSTRGSEVVPSSTRARLAKWLETQEATSIDDAWGEEASDGIPPSRRTTYRPSGAPTLRPSVRPTLPVPEAAAAAGLRAMPTGFEDVPDAALDAPTDALDAPADAPDAPADAPADASKGHVPSS